MNAYPIHYRVPEQSHFSRLQLAVRVLAFLALGIAGVSFGGVFLFAYLALPVFAAIRLAAPGGAETYLREDGPRVLAALHWFAAISAWAGLVSERLPHSQPAEVVTLAVDPGAWSQPTPGRAAWRVVTGLPSAFVLALLGAIGVLVWVWAALCVVARERVGPGAFDYLVGLQRWSVRLLAWQASLVDTYPPFSFGEAPSRASGGLHPGGPAVHA